mmetsp:Transcript_60092/g.139992  ORF Transcript_60092/g.139992 Transcript_60092/m.139992 type:complete len:200 (+) Transcript_60092:239-838(+)
MACALAETLASSFTRETPLRLLPASVHGSPCAEGLQSELRHRWMLALGGRLGTSRCRPPRASGRGRSRSEHRGWEQRPGQLCRPRARKARPCCAAAVSHRAPARNVWRSERLQAQRQMLRTVANSLRRWHSRSWPQRAAAVWKGLILLILLLELCTSCRRRASLPWAVGLTVRWWSRTLWSAAATACCSALTAAWRLRM